MKSKVLKVAFCIPNEAYVQAESLDTFLVAALRMGKIEKTWEMENRNPRYEVYFNTTGRLMTAYAREVMMKKAIANNFDYILMLDNDMVIPPDFFEAMIYDMEENDEIDILAALAFMRNPPHWPVMYTLKDGFDPEYNKQYYLMELVKNYPKDQLVECDAVGFGGVLIRLDKIRRMQEPYFFTTDGRGEDVFFCHEAKRQVNARVFMDTRIKLGHLKNPEIITEEYALDWLKNKKVDLGSKQHKYLNNQR